MPAARASSARVKDPDAIFTPTVDAPDETLANKADRCNATRSRSVATESDPRFSRSTLGSLCGRIILLVDDRLQRLLLEQHPVETDRHEAAGDGIGPPGRHRPRHE